MKNPIQSDKTASNNKETIRLTVHDLTPETDCCAECGRPYDKIDYATAVYVDTKVTGGGTGTVSSKYYREFTRHVGGYCRFCDATEKLKTSLIVLASGVAALVAGILLQTALKPAGAPIGLIVAGGFTTFYGFVSAIVAFGLRRGSRDVTADVLCRNFMRRLKKDGLQKSSLVYFTPEEAKNLVGMPW